MKRIALACALMACGVDHVVEQRATLAPEVGAQGVAGATGPAGEVGPAGADGAPGAAGAWEVYGGDGADLGPLVTVRFEGAAAVFMLYDAGRFIELDAEGAPMRSTGLFTEDPACGPPWFEPSTAGRLDSDALGTFVLDWYGPRSDGLLVRGDEPERVMAMRCYVLAAPDGSPMTVPLPEEQGSAPGIAVTLLRRERATGPLHLAPR